MNRRNQYLLGIFTIAPVWFAISICLCRMLARVADSTALGTTVPLWLKAAGAVAYPLRYLLPDDGFAGLSEHANSVVGLCLMLANSMVWSFVLVFLFRFGTGLYSARKTEVQNVAKHEFNGRSDTTMLWRS